MKISLILCTRNRPDILVSNLLHNLTEFSIDDEIIIVDSSDNTKLRNFFLDIPYPNLLIYNTAPGLPMQRNIGISKSNGDILLFLDDDIRLYKGAVENLRNFFIQNCHINGVTGMLLEKNEPSRKKQFLERIFSKVFFTPYFGKSGFTKSGMPIIPLSNESYHNSSFMRGGFSAYRSIVFLEHKFDEYFNGYAYLEDTEFSLSLRNKHALVFLPEFKGFHDHLSALQKDHSNSRKQYIENYYYIFNKYALGSKSLFYWTVLGILLTNFFKSFISMNFSFFSGTLYGIFNVINKTK